MKKDEEKCEIEITPEMIEAGIEIIWGFDREFDSAGEAVAQIFRAMLAARRVPFFGSPPMARL